MYMYVNVNVNVKIINNNENNLSEEKVYINQYEDANKYKLL